MCIGVCVGLSKLPQFEHVVLMLRIDGLLSCSDHAFHFIQDTLKPSDAEPDQYQSTQVLPTGHDIQSDTPGSKASVPNNDTDDI